MGVLKMSDGNSMNGLSSFHSYEDLAHYVSTTKPNMGSVNRGKIPLGERRYTSLFWCRTNITPLSVVQNGTAIEMFCESRGPVFRWYEDNSIEILSDNSHYDWRFAEFLSRTIHGVHFFTHHGKLYWEEWEEGSKKIRNQMASSGDPWFLPLRNLDNELNKSYRIIKKDDKWIPESPIQEYKHVMDKKRMREIREKFKPFYKYMKAVLSVDPEFGLGYDKDWRRDCEFETPVNVEEFEIFLRNPVDDPEVMKEVLVRCTSGHYMEYLGRHWCTHQLRKSSRKFTRIGYKQVKEQFDLMLKIFYFKEVFNYTPIEIGLLVHDTNAQLGYSKWGSK
jgi:hypothetical protein